MALNVSGEVGDFPNREFPHFELHGSGGGFERIPFRDDNRVGRT